MINLKTIAYEIRAEAAIATRPGQMNRLETLARWLDEADDAIGVQTTSSETEAQRD